MQYSSEDQDEDVPELIENCKFYDNLIYDCLGRNYHKTIYMNDRILDSIVPLLGYHDVTYLDMSSNNITSLEGIEKLDKLDFIDISDNPLVDISPLSKLKNLKIVRCNGINIQNFDIFDKNIHFHLTYFPGYEKKIDGLSVCFNDFNSNSIFKINHYKYRFDHDNKEVLFFTYKERMERSMERLERNEIRVKILYFWLSFFEMKKDRFGYNRLSYLAFFSEMIK